MGGGESFKLFNNVAAGTSSTVGIRGGKYDWAFSGSGSGTADLYMVGPDGSTGIKVATQITATTGHQVVDLAPGAYYSIVGTFTANYMTLTRIPGE